MIDLHTHILPGMDDGAKDVEMSLAMLRAQRKQGVDTVVLTPHFYRDRERPKWFLDRRMEAAQILARAILVMSEDEQNEIPRLMLGAEVAWVPNLSDWEELPQLCIGSSRNLLLELPFTPWTAQLIDQLYDLPGKTGITPVIAHLERYEKIQRPEYIHEILSLGFPVQVSSDVLLQPLRRGKVLKMLRQGQAHLLASDSHNLTTRPPNLGQAMEIVERKLGSGQVQKLKRRAEQLVDSH